MVASVTAQLVSVSTIGVSALVSKFLCIISAPLAITYNADGSFTIAEGLFYRWGGVLMAFFVILSLLKTWRAWLTRDKG